MIISPFNAGFFILIAASAAVTVFLSLFLRKASEKIRRNIIIGICILCIILFFSYKLALKNNAELLAADGITEFQWMMELPLQFCKINMFIIPIALLTNKRYLLAFCVFLAPLGAFFAIVCPEYGYSGYSLFELRIAYYYITHLLIIIAGILIRTLGFYRFSFRDIPSVVLTLITLMTIIYGFNCILRFTGYPDANYFYTMRSNGSAALDLFWKICPHEYWYTYLTLFIGIPYMLIVCLCSRIADKLRSRSGRRVTQA